MAILSTGTSTAIARRGFPACVEREFTPVSPEESAGFLRKWNTDQKEMYPLPHVHVAAFLDTSSGVPSPTILASSPQASKHHSWLIRSWPPHSLPFTSLSSYGERPDAKLAWTKFSPATPTSWWLIHLCPQNAPSGHSSPLYLLYCL